MGTKMTFNLVVNSIFLFSLFHLQATPNSNLRSSSMFSQDNFDTPKDLLSNFFKYLAFLGNPENKIDPNSLQSFFTDDCTVQSNHLLLTQGIDEFIAYINRNQERFEKVSYSNFLDEPVIAGNKATLHFQVDCTEKKGRQKNLDVIAIVTFKDGKICNWEEVYCDISDSNPQSSLSYVNRVLQPKTARNQGLVISLDHTYEEPLFNHPLYSVNAPSAEGYLAVSEVHSLFYATYGNPKGIPVVVLHGGPGEGCHDVFTRFFDLNRYYVIMFDQRGSMRSKPFGSMHENAPEFSIADIESLRKHLGIEKWLVLGGSWGSTLAILYGQNHPEHCLGFILKGVFLGREQDYLHLLYGMGKLFPKAYEAFLSHIPEDEHSDLLSAYHKRIMHPDPAVHMPAARAFIQFDATCVHFSSNPLAVEKTLKNDSLVYCVSKTFFHYARNKFFLEDTQILSGMDKIKHLPAILIHGKYDAVTLPEMSFLLYQKWDNSTLWMVPQGGHASTEPAVASAMATALDFFADRLH
jgi:proline iminopeptidase